MKALQKSSLREIRKSLGRYLAILAIVALGVGFFCGLRVCRDAMVETGDDYLDRQSMYDYRLVSTVGFDQDDAEAFAGISGVTAAAGAVSQDALVDVDGLDMSGVIIFNSLTENVNEISLTAGRLPRAGNEAVADAQFFPVDSIGKTIVLSDTNDEDTLDMFAYREYTIVGLGNSPTYLNYERGSTSLGTGSVMAFAYIPYEGFDCDYYTDIYIRLDTEGEIYSDEYQAGVEQYEDSVTHSGESQARERFETLVGDAESELDDGIAEYDEGYTEYLEERDKAERELLDALDEITVGRAEIIANEQLLKDSEAELRDGRSQYDSGRRELNSAESQLESAEEETYAQLDATQAQLESQLTTVQDGMAQIEESGVLEQYQQLTEAIPQLEEGVSQLQAARDALNATGETLRSGIAAAEQSITDLGNQKAEALAPLEAQRTALEGEINALEEELSTLQPGDDDRIAELNAQLAELRPQLTGLQDSLAATTTDYETRINAAQQTRDGLSTQAAAAQEAVTALTTERDNALAPLQSELSQVEGNISTKQAELSALDPGIDAEQIATLQGEISALEARKGELEGEISTKRAEYDGPIATAQGEYDTLAGQLAEAEGTLSGLQDERDATLGELNGQIARRRGQHFRRRKRACHAHAFARRRAPCRVLAALAEKRPALEGVTGEITTTAAITTARSPTAKAQKEAPGRAAFPVRGGLRRNPGRDRRQLQPCRGSLRRRRPALPPSKRAAMSKATSKCREPCAVAGWPCPGAGRTRAGRQRICLCPQRDQQRPRRIARRTRRDRIRRTAAGPTAAPSWRTPRWNLPTASRNMRTAAGRPTASSCRPSANWPTPRRDRRRAGKDCRDR